MGWGGTIFEDIVLSMLESESGLRQREMNKFEGKQELIGKEYHGLDHCDVWRNDSTFEGLRLLFSAFDEGISRNEEGLRLLFPALDGGISRNEMQTNLWTFI